MYYFAGPGDGAGGGDARQMKTRRTKQQAHLDTVVVGWKEPLSLALSPLRRARESETCLEALPRCVRKERDAFTLIEVMIAVAIFCVAMFALLALLNSGLHAAQILRRNAPTPGMAIAELTQTNKLKEGAISGAFGEVYPDYRWQGNIWEVATNGLFQVDVTVTHNSAFYSSMSLLLYRPDSGK
jgi:prepilin-type N-terminal cleavage/methylation domain-containing protein